MLFCETYKITELGFLPSLCFCLLAQWGVQCGNNPTVQWIEITPAVAEVGLSYTVTCASGATLSVAVVTATDPDLFNTTAAVALAWCVELYVCVCV